MPASIAFATANRVSVSSHSHHLQSARSHQLKALPFALVTAAGLSLGLVGGAAQAATIVVNSSADTGGAGLCTLRDAMLSMSNQSPSSYTSGSIGCAVASGAFGTADTITFANTVTNIGLTQGYPLQYSPSQNAQLLVQGRGQGGITISRPTSQASGLILQYGGDLTLDGITLTGGQSGAGGAVQLAPGFNGLTKFQLKNSVVTGNSATSAGGAIYSASYGTAVSAVTIVNSTISANNQAYGGAIDGAGIYLYGPSVLTMTGSTVSGNGSSSTTRGGGIYASDSATVTLTNSTISGNTSNCEGAGLYSAISSSNTSASVTLTNVTVTANTQSGACLSGGGLFQAGGSITLNNTLIAGNVFNSAASDMASTTALNATGSNNLVRNVASTVTFTNAPLTSNPLLGPLANNGGVTFTHALLSGSPAINAGSSTSVLTTDQRGTGFPRLSGSAVDIGAFEFISIVNGACGSASSSTPVLVAPTANLCSAGTATAVAGSGPWTWGCNGSGAGSSTSATACSVPIQTWSVTPSVATGAGSGAISPATAVSVNNNTTSTFTLTPASGYTTTSVTGCNGTLNSGGTVYTTGQVTASCNVIASFSLSPINGACGSASSSTPVLVAPISNLCSTGTATAVSGPSPSNFTWGCNGNNTGTSTALTACFAPIQTWSVIPSVATGATTGTISPSASVSVNNNATSTFAVTPAAGYAISTVTGCGATLTTSISVYNEHSKLRRGPDAQYYTTGPVTASCNVVASFALTPINGACGSASSATPALVVPTSNLCATGTATAVSGSGPWTWGCNGNATGTSTSVTACSVAIKTWTVTPSVSGGNGAIAPSTAVSVNNNAATSFTVTPSSGYNIASVIGCGGTRNGALFSIVAVTADCSVVAMFSAIPRAALSLSGNSTSIPSGSNTPAQVNGTDFGTRIVGQNVINSFVLANNGTTTYTINNMSFTGANAADFTIISPTAFPVIVNAGASITFSVRFTPSNSGQRNAALVIALDDGLPSVGTNTSHLKALGTVGFAVQGVGVQDIPASVPVPAWGLSGLMASLLGLLLTGFAALRRGGKR